ncbi:hypothetical protein GGI04_000352 [Coemansia thaxteri]|uniref:Coatomer subunit epsilon n=1 Tax=Coemansia thaxteri TaxID=2663907 RepID=A0A9W8BHP9_9FUNG|nr:hypothetical protein H4R26_000390 [Coemansia thaxteri]KAJ2009553.1 hypothetical protein GGI04_000352 [Coemansia thaxteri]KAJ2332148.1 hypothetical protein GGH92_009015 [Coemansia sp. RSA 2673]KAJ2474450.1 hypothetical protein GGI02_000072 [Coemansia sp. RSA 2322]KAJ2487710.1 hypothetical protein EV174_000381 [Coemansia sp. RSA 2320]
MSEVVDVFYSARNLLYLGAYPQALAALASLPRSVPETERQSLQYRAHLGQGNAALVLSEIPATTTNATLKAIRHLAQHTPISSEELQVDANLQDGGFVVIAAQLLAAKNPDEALRILALHPRNIECAALTVAVYLRLNRVDLAQKLVVQLRQWSEDAPIAQLAEAWTALAAGGSAKCGEALSAFEELAHASSVSTARLLCSLAVTKMHLLQFQEAMGLLQRALEMDPNDPDTLANLAICASLTGDQEEARPRLLTQLAHAAPAHPLLKDIEFASASFDAALAKLRA